MENQGDINKEADIKAIVAKYFYDRIEGNSDSEVPVDEYKIEAERLVDEVSAHPEYRSKGKLSVLLGKIFSESFGERYDPEMFANFEDDLLQILNG